MTTHQLSAVLGESNPLLLEMILSQQKKLQFCYRQCQRNADPVCMDNCSVQFDEIKKLIEESVDKHTRRKLN